MNIKQYLPIDEGVTHINIYSKSKLELGKLLSNFAKTPFTHPVYGEFASVEAFWYWLSTGKKHDSLKKLYGYKAKVEGKTFERVTIDNFKEELIFVLQCKLDQNPFIGKLLSEATLPIVHYYYYGTIEEPRVVVPTMNEWITKWWETKRKELQNVVN